MMSEPEESFEVEGIPLGFEPRQTLKEYWDGLSKLESLRAEIDGLMERALVEVGLDLVRAAVGSGKQDDRRRLADALRECFRRHLGAATANDVQEVVVRRGVVWAVLGMGDESAHLLHQVLTLWVRSDGKEGAASGRAVILRSKKIEKLFISIVGGPQAGLILSLDPSGEPRVVRPADGDVFLRVSLADQPLSPGDKSTV